MTIERFLLPALFNLIWSLNSDLVAPNSTPSCDLPMASRAGGTSKALLLQLFSPILGQASSYFSRPPDDRRKLQSSPSHPPNQPRHAQVSSLTACQPPPHVCFSCLSRSCTRESCCSCCSLASKRTFHLIKNLLLKSIKVCNTNNPLEISCPRS